MNNNFKNPFDTDEENSTMISLDPVTTAYTSIQPTFLNSKPPPESQPKPTISEASMFDTLEPQPPTTDSELNEDDEPPLLEDIGIDLELIKRRMRVAVTLEKADEELITSPDLSGPILIALSLGCLLLLGGKMHFSDIESGFLVGNLGMYVLFNYMTKSEPVPLYNVMSLLGYSLLPMLLLAFFGIFTVLSGPIGLLTSLALAFWCSVSAGNTVGVLLGREDSRALLVYPLFLFYLSFAMIIIF